MTINICSLTCAQWEALLNTYSVRLIAPAMFDELPITLEDAYHHLRIDTFTSDDSPPDSPPAIVSGDDYWLENIGIPAAVQWAEEYMGKALASQTLELVGTTFPAEYFEFQIGPVQEVLSVVYFDEDDVEQTMDPLEYQLNTDTVPARLQLAYGVDAWPTARNSFESVRVRYVAGYTPTGNSPTSGNITNNARIGILLILGHLYENREDTTALNLMQIPTGARSFLDWGRVRRGFA